MPQIEKLLRSADGLGRVRGHRLRWMAVLLVAAAPLAGVIGYVASASGQDGGESAPVFVDKIPEGYRDWRLISVAHEEGNLHSFAAVLGNDVAIKAYREGALPFPDGAIVAALHWRHVPSEENNRIFGRSQSFVAGSATNVQFMVKDSKKYAATGGWGFAHFNGREDKPAAKALLQTCFPCHNRDKDHDLVFTRYAP
jgi:Cytochrome P460